MRRATALTLLAGGMMLAGATRAIAHSGPNFAQVVALDECDPDSFNMKVELGDWGKAGLAFATTSRSLLLAMRPRSPISS